MVNPRTALKVRCQPWQEGSALAQGVVGGAILGGGSSLLTGGNPLSGAIRGGLGAFAPMVSEGIQHLHQTLILKWLVH